MLESQVSTKMAVLSCMGAGNIPTEILESALIINGHRGPRPIFLIFPGRFYGLV
jgi:hypothetical protein